MVFWRVIIYVASAQVSLTFIHYRNDVTGGHVAPVVSIVYILNVFLYKCLFSFATLLISTTPYQ